MKLTPTLLISLAILLFCANTLVAAPSSSSSSRYQTWTPPGGETIGHASNNSQSSQQQMVDRLNRLVDDAEKSHAADKNFIRDLRSVLDEHNQLSEAQLLYEDFTDGVVSKNPAWVGPSSSFKLERGRGMYSRVDASNTSKSKKQSDKELANALLGALFKSSSNKSSADHHGGSGPATLYVRTAISNGFVVKASIDPRSTQGRIALGMFQSKPGGSSYQLVFTPGNSSAMELQRVSAGRTTTIKTKDHLRAPSNHKYQLQWTRDIQGNMTVQLDGKTILQTADNAIRNSFDGFSVTNHSGEFYLQSVELFGLR